MRILLVERMDLLIGFGLVILAGLAFELFVAGLNHIVEKHFEGETVKSWQWWYTGGCFVLTVVLSCVIWSARQAFRKLHVRYQIRSEEMPKPYLVIFVSRQNLIKTISDLPENGSLTISGATLGRTDLLSDAELMSDTQKTPWSWEMVLRAIAPHLSKLKRIYLVGSRDLPGKESSGTFAHCEMLHRFLLPYLVAAGKAATASGAEHLIVSWPKPVDFESFTDVHETLVGIRDKLAEEGSAEVEMCVDITGGQKTTSAAAGLFTVNSNVVIQYVQTNPPKQSKMYDVRWLDWLKKPE
jgi:hypothetical protein